jgi:hypothetical protein
MFDFVPVRNWELVGSKTKASEGKKDETSDEEDSCDSQET